MVSKSTTNVLELGNLAGKLTHNYEQLASDSKGAISLTANSEVAQRIRNSVHDLGQGSVHLVKAAGSCQACPNDSFTERNLQESARSMLEKVSVVLAALQAGSRGTQACINAASTVSG